MPRVVLIFGVTRGLSAEGCLSYCFVFWKPVAGQQGWRLMMEMTENKLNITELRRQRRPLWMSDLDIDNFADFLGGGGDVYTDRLPPAFPRHEGMELSEAEEQEVGPVRLEKD